MANELVINCKQIPEEGMELNVSVSAKEMDLTYKDIISEGEVGVYATVLLVSNEIIVQGRIEASYACECDRCLSPMEIPVEVENFTLNYEYKDQDFQDISPEIRDEILLMIPTKILCSTDCMGLCPKCRANLNKTKCSCSLKKETLSPFHSLELDFPEIPKEGK